MPDSFTPIHGVKDIWYCSRKSILIFDAILLYISYRTYSCFITFLINKLFYAYLNIFPQAAPLSGGNGGLVLLEPDFYWCPHKSVGTVYPVSVCPFPTECRSGHFCHAPLLSLLITHNRTFSLPKTPSEYVLLLYVDNLAHFLLSVRWRSPERGCRNDTV